MNQKIDIEIRKRRMTVEIEGFTAIEIHSLAGEVSDRMGEIEQKYNIADSSKLAILTALEYAAELSHLKESQGDSTRVVENTLSKMALSLQKSLAKHEERAR